METRHLKFNYEQVLDTKKQLLSMELNLLHILKSLKAYKISRKRELTEKNKLKVKLSSLRTKVKSIQSAFPRQKDEKEMPKKTKGIKKQDKKNIQKELEDIKAKLEMLK